MNRPAWETTVTRLVEERGDALTRYAWLLCGDRDDAADLVQDALVKIFGRLRNGFTVPAAEAYVRRAILTTFLDGGRRRTRWRHIAHLTAVPDRIEPPSKGSEERLDIWHELSRLAPRERACVVLRYYDDLTVDGIASELGISAGAVKRYLSDGLAKMAVSISHGDERDRAREARDVADLPHPNPIRTATSPGGTHAH